MGMKLNEAIERFKNNAEYERTHGNLQGCLEFKQLAKWLEELRAYRNMYHADNVDNCLREKVVEDGNDENVLVGCIGCKYSGVSKHVVCNSCINMNRYEQEVLENETN